MNGLACKHDTTTRWTACCPGSVPDGRTVNTNTFLTTGVRVTAQFESLDPGSTAEKEFLLNF